VLARGFRFVTLAEIATRLSAGSLRVAAGAAG